MDCLNEYRQKLRTPQQAVNAVKSGDWVDYGMGLSMPELLDEALAERKDELSEVKIRGLLALRPLKIVESDPEQRAFTYNSWHFSGYERGLHDRGLCSYIPMIYRNNPVFYRNHLNVNVACLSAAPMDRHGYFSFSLTNSALKAIAEKADTVIIEVNDKLPRVLGGYDECIHISEVNMVVEGEHKALVELKPPQASKVERMIAEAIVSQIEDGSTIQLGIGGMPNAVGQIIAQSDLKDIGMHTEMLASAYLDMHKNGKLTNKRKTADRNKGVWSFCAGTRELYDWVADNPGLASYPVDYVNSPEVMAKNDRLITINNCIEVDLYGQTCSEASGTRHISGTGGQLDFLTGGFMSEGGKSFICMASTYIVKETGKIRSRIVSRFCQGSVVTDPRSQAYYLATEWGVVNLAGRSTWERAELIISLAHPDFRDRLIKEAEIMKIWRRSNK